MGTRLSVVIITVRFSAHPYLVTPLQQSIPPHHSRPTQAPLLNLSARFLQAWKLRARAVSGRRKWRVVQGRRIWDLRMRGQAWGDREEEIGNVLLSRSGISHRIGKLGLGMGYGMTGEDLLV